MQDVLQQLFANGQGYSELSLSFNSPFSHLTILIDLILVGLGALVYWWWRLYAMPVKRRLLLIGLRTAALILVLFLLFDPVLLAHRLEPGRHFVLMLFDDSQSMGIAGADGQTRGQHLRTAYTDTRFEQAVRRAHQVTLFRFGADAERLRHPSQLRYAQSHSDLVGAIDQAVRKMHGTHVSAVVLFSDGIQQSTEPPEFTSLPAGIPVFTVGADADSSWRSLELAALAVERTAFDHSPVALRAHIRSAGFAGAAAQLEILDGERPVAATTFNLNSTDNAQPIRLEFVPDRQGWRHYRARVRLTAIETAAKDPIRENDSRDFLVDNRARIYRILFFGGQPSWEHKFIRRALDPDPELAFASLIRISGAERQFVFRGQNTSLANPLFEGYDDEARDAPRYDEAVFLRLGLGASELADGYPKEAAELFGYDLVIWSDIERDFFSQHHLELMRDFVTRRGGSLLLSGNPQLLGASGYARSPIAAMLPAALQPGHAGPFAFQVQPTIEGQLSGVFSLTAEPDPALWQRLPSLYGLTRLSPIRAGATILARTDDGQPLFAWQRYGEGTTALLATGTTWRWQLLAPDQSHQHFWRQLARALVRTAPDPVLMSAGEELHVGEQSQLEFTVRDSLYILREGLSTHIALRGPDGREVRLPTTESLAEAGLYTAAFNPKQPGLHTVAFQARDPHGASVATLAEAVLVHPDHREFADARANPSFLAQLAEHSGGAFYTPDRLMDLPAQLPITDFASRRSDRFHLWHWPPFYALVVLLLGSEWYLRRRQGQP